MSQLPSLTLMRDGASIKTFEIEGEVVLGRAAGCTIRVSDRAISRQHAVFRSVGNSIQVEKKSDFAPLIVNGAECTSAILKAGDIVSAGPYMIRYEGLPLDGAVSNTGDKKEKNPAVASPGEGSSLLSAGSLDGAASAGDPNANLGGQPEGDPFAAAQGVGLEGGEAGAGGGAEGAAGQELGDGAGQGGDGVAGASEGAAGNGGFGEVGAGEGMGEAGQVQMDGASQEPALEAEADGPIDEEGKTKITPSGKVAVKLIFQPGAANVTEYELTKDITFLGRGKDCDIILNDKKASRKNAMIRRSGLSYIIKDLESSNGTFVNGIKIQEQELSGDDLVKIGNVEFVFKAMSVDYLAKEKDLTSLPEEEPIPDSPLPPEAVGVLGGDLAGVPPGQTGEAGVAGGLDLSGKGLEAGGIPGITGMGTSGADTGKKKSIVDKFKALPRRTQIIAVIAIGLFLWWVMEDDQSPVSIKKKSGAGPKKTVTASTGDKGPLTFEMLTPEKKRFVESQHSLAFDHYKNKDYDKALFEITKIFELINDYKDAREIERYAKEGKRKMEAIEEERKKKEDEAILKAKVTQLVEETRQRMDKKEYEQAKEYFIQILGIDPDNQSIALWRKEIEAYEEQLKMQAQQKQVEEDINKHGWSLYAEALLLKKRGRYHDAMPVFQKAIDIGISDPKLTPAAKAMIAACRRAIARLRDPVLKEAKNLEEAGEFSKAYATYRKATRIDPPHPGGYAGMNRIRKVLHDRAKVAYTEAVLAESYSDFATARKMFEECLQIAPPEDVYHDRALRKLSRYFKRKEEGQ